MILEGCRSCFIVSLKMCIRLEMCIIGNKLDKKAKLFNTGLPFPIPSVFNFYYPYKNENFHTDGLLLCTKRTDFIIYHCQYPSFKFQELRYIYFYEEGSKAFFFFFLMVVNRLNEMNTFNKLDPFSSTISAQQCFCFHSFSDCSTETIKEKEKKIKQHAHWPAIKK